MLKIQGEFFSQKVSGRLLKQKKTKVKKQEQQTVKDKKKEI